LIETEAIDVSAMPN